MSAAVASAVALEAMRKDINSVANDVKNISAFLEKNEKRHRRDAAAHATLHSKDAAAHAEQRSKDAAAHAEQRSKDAELHREDVAAFTAQLVAFEAQRRDDAMRLEAQRRDDAMRLEVRHREDAAALAVAHREEMRKLRHAIKDLETGLKSEELARARAEQARTSVPEISTAAAGRK